MHETYQRADKNIFVVVESDWLDFDTFELQEKYWGQIVRLTNRTFSDLDQKYEEFAEKGIIMYPYVIRFVGENTKTLLDGKGTSRYFKRCSIITKWENKDILNGE